MPEIDQGPFLGFACSYTDSTFHGSQTPCNAKGSMSKRAEKKRKETGSKQNWEQVMAKKKTNKQINKQTKTQFGLMRMSEIEIFHNFAFNPRKFSRFGEKS